MSSVTSGKVNSLLAVKWTVALGVPLSIFFLSPFDFVLRAYLAVTLGAILFWALQLIPEAITGLLIPILFCLIGVATPDLAFSSWSMILPWLVLAGIIMGNVMTTTGLVKRLAYKILLWTGCSCRGLMIACFAIGVFLPLLVSSTWAKLLILGPIGIAHNCVAFLFPFFSETFGLDTAHNGYLSGTLAFFWVLAILFGGRLAARKGQIRVMTPGLLVGGMALLALALSRSVAMLYVLTAVVGLGCGTIVSASLSFLAEQSDPKYRGLFYGTAQSSFTLIGSALGSVVFTRLGASDLGWRGCYALMGLLVVMAAFCIFMMGRCIPTKAPADTLREDKVGYIELFAYKNVVLTTVLACLAMMWYFTVAAFTILYLMEAKQLTAVAAGAIFAGFGSGGFIGEFIASFFSDHLGRKSTILLVTLIGGVLFAVFLFVPLNAVGMTLSIAGASCFMSGAMAICNSVVPSESVPLRLVATATSFTPACGELMGGVVAPVLAGICSRVIGTVAVMQALVVLPLFIVIGVLFLQETAPSVCNVKKQ